MNYPTWSDLNSESIVPPLGARKGRSLGPVAVMAACEPDFRQVNSHIAAPLSYPFFNSTLITAGGSDKGICVVGPFIGAPYAAMLLESLIAGGVEKIIMLGWCGAVTTDFVVGDLILPDKAIVDEGTSCNYCRLDDRLPSIGPDSDLGRQFSDVPALKAAGVRRTVVWTTDAIYRETPKKVSYFRQLGARVVEMECSALFSVGQYRNVSITALLTVSDSVASKEWQPGFRKKRFKQARNTACDAALYLARELNTTREPNSDG